MDVLLSIKPKFANAIFSGEKKFVFRRVIFKDKTVKKVYVYASKPIGLVIGDYSCVEQLRKGAATQQVSGLKPVPPRSEAVTAVKAPG